MQTCRRSLSIRSIPFHIVIEDDTNGNIGLTRSINHTSSSIQWRTKAKVVVFFFSKNSWWKLDLVDPIQGFFGAGEIYVYCGWNHLEGFLFVEPKGWMRQQEPIFLLSIFEHWLAKTSLLCPFRNRGAQTPLYFPVNAFFDWEFDERQFNREEILTWILVRKLNRFLST